MYSKVAMAIGLAIAVLAGTGCVSAKSLRAVVQTVADSQADIVAGLDGLDAACQARGKTEGELQACRGPRDAARQALRNQLDAVSAWAK